MGMLTLEFVMWNNCCNNCQFCWQRLWDDKTTHLNEAQKLECIKQCSQMIDAKGTNCDILIVGGEVYCDHGQKVNEALAQLYKKVADKIRSGEVRFLYANTNLTYSNRSNLLNLLEAFKGIEDSLKFTTSYDLSGRFNRQTKDEMDKVCAPLNREQLFFDNLAFINDNYPKVNTVVNTIITRAVADAVMGKRATDKIQKDKVANTTGAVSQESAGRSATNVVSKKGTDRQDVQKYDPLWLMDKYPNTVAWVNLIPYIPIKGDTSLDVKYSETVKVLEVANKKEPGYFRRYVESLDQNQDKLLYEYHSDEGLVEKTADTKPCGHNENFSLINRADECYLCKLKEYYIDNQERLH